MTRFNSLFWKVFFSFWFVNLLIVALTTFIVVSISERERNSEIHKIRLQNVSERIIDSIESGTSDISQWQEGKWHNHDEQHNTLAVSGEASRDKRFSRRIPPLKIYSDSGELIFSTPINKRTERREKLTVEVEGESGKNYTVQGFVGPRSHLKKALNFFTRVQLVLILVGSMIVSLSLSWTIAKPLKKLSHFSKHYMPGGKSEIDSKLLERKDEIGDLSQSFQLMLKKLELTLQRQKHLLHDVSHELRAPLSRLQVAVGLLEESNSQDKTPLLKRLHKECGRIDQLIQEILNYSKMDVYQSKPESINLKERLMATLENIQFIEPKRTVNLHMPENVHIVATPELVVRVLDNVFNNALSHTPVECEIDVTVRKALERCHIIIRDHGPGVKEEELGKLFELFYRGNNEMHGKGFGLGLSIAKRAIEQDSGSIHLHNHPEGGLQVELVYPIA